MTPSSRSGLKVRNATGPFEASVTSPEDIKLIVEDEERYLDRANTHRYLVDEVEHWKET